MAKIRIYEWAKQNGKRSVEVVKLLQQNGHKVRNHTSTIEEDILKQLFNVDESEEREITTIKN